MNNNSISHSNHLIRIERHQKYGSIGLETLMDGHWWLPQSCLKRIENLMRDYGIKNYSSGSGGLYADRIPLEIIDELAQCLYEIIVSYRPDFYRPYILKQD